MNYKDSHIFVDSGAHSLFVREILKKKHGNLDFSYYETDEFWDYVDAYGKFIKENEHLLTTYVSVDVIHNPELSWKVQKYLENTYKISPLPVYHSGEDFSWFKKYCDDYDYIGVSGLGQEVSKTMWVKNIGIPVFNYICKPPNYLPTHKIHGFAMTSPDLVVSYPWYSIDSTSWIQFGKYGIVVIPYKENGNYIYTRSPCTVFISSRKASKEKINHFDNTTTIFQNYFYDYFSEKGCSIGNSEFKTVSSGYTLLENESWCDRKKGIVEIILEKGLSNSHEVRDKLNLEFYLDLEASLPEWPYPWIRKIKQTRLF